MRIFLSANYSPWSRYRGGGQRSTHFLASALAQRGHDVSVIFSKPPWERVVTPALPYRLVWAALADVRSRRNAVLRPLSALSVAERVRELARERAPDVVHAQGEEGALVARVVECPLLLTPRYPYYPPELARRVQERGLRRAVAWLFHAKYLALGVALRSATLVCPTSQASARSVQNAFGVSAERLRVVPNGVDPEFMTCARDAEAARGPIVFFGRVETDKGVEVLLEAYLRVLGHRRKLLIFGEGSRTRWLREIVVSRRLTDQVELCPWQSATALAERLSKAALVVLPSRYESFGNTMIEALAAGAPLITTKVGSLPELIRHGDTGHLVPAEDVAALAQAVDTLLSDPARAERMGRAGRAHVSATYAWDRVAAQYEAIYAEAATLRKGDRSFVTPGAAHA